MRSIAVLAVLAAAACSAPPPPPAPPPKPAEPAQPTPPPAPAAPTAPTVAEPAGVGAGTHKIPDAPKGKGLWVVDPKGTEVTFTIMKASGAVTGSFQDGTAGAYDAKAKKGVFTVDITKMSTGKGAEANPLRDANIIESFFGARPFASTPANKANEAKKPDVEAAWKKLDGKIATGITRAALVIDSVEGAAADPKEGKTEDGVVNGRLVLWESVEVPVTFPVTVTKKKNTLEVKGKAPATFNIEKVTGTSIRNDLFANMIAAGCAHQAGVKNDVSVDLKQVTLHKK